MKCCSSPSVLSMMSLPLASRPLGSPRQSEFLPKARARLLALEATWNPVADLTNTDQRW